MESLVSTTSTASRDILAEELTNLRSLLRLNADGIGDEVDLITQLNQLGSPFPNALAIQTRLYDSPSPISQKRR